MNMDFHVHGILSKKLNFNKDLFLQGIEFAKNNKLDSFVLSEHFNAIDIDSSFSFLEGNFPYDYENDRYDVNGFYVYLGMEVDVKYGGHVIISGKKENMFKIKDYLKNFKKKADFIYLKDLLDMADEYGFLKIGSHPYREKHKLYLQSDKYLQRLDALDLNSKDIYKRGLKTVEKEVADLAGMLKINYVTGSDSHYPIMLGCVRTSFNDNIKSINDIKNAIRQNDFKRTVCDDINLKIYTAKATKNYIKKKIKAEKLKENEISKN
ncbi:MAG: PHP-associated domain-containing protein [Clostridium sp.]